MSDPQLEFSWQAPPQDLILEFDKNTLAVKAVLVRALITDRLQIEPND